MCASTNQNHPAQLPGPRRGSGGPHLPPELLWAPVDLMNEQMAHGYPRSARRPGNDRVGVAGPQGRAAAAGRMPGLLICLILVPTPCPWTPSLQSCETINFHCFKLPSLWYFVTTNMIGLWRSDILTLLSLPIHDAGCVTLF